MCLIMQIKDKEVNITKEEFKINLNRNPHGTGIMFANNGKIIVRKELSDINKQVTMFTKYTNSVRKGSIKELLIHSRLATHGAKDEFNCHPYQVIAPNEGTELWCMHNGIIQCKSPEADKSDSYNFLTYYIKPMIKNRLTLLKDPYFLEMISKYIGTGSKLVFLDSTGETYFVNKDQGVDYKGSWISNEYSGIRVPYVAPAYKGSNTAKGGYHGSMGNWQDDDDNYYYSGNTKKKSTIMTDYTQNEDGSYSKIIKKGDVIPLNNCLVETKKKEEDGFEDKAIQHGIKLLIAAFKTMTQEEVYNFCIQEPLITSEVLSELLESTEIVVGV